MLAFDNNVTNVIFIPSTNKYYIFFNGCTEKEPGCQKTAYIRLATLLV